MKLSSVNIDALEKAKGSLNAYLSGNINFSALVNRLDALRYGLVDFDNEWLSQYGEKWLVLEEINALALDEMEVMPLDEYVDLADKKINEIELMIDLALNPDKLINN